MVLRKMMDVSITHKEVALTQLCIGAIFFAMRSCEYLKSTHSEDSKRTKILRLKNIRFKKDGIILNHNSPFLMHADLVAITFEFQKNNRRNRTVHMFSTNDSLLCPVKAWASTVKRIWNTIPGANGDTRVCSYNDQGSTRDLDSNYARSRIRAIVELIGKTRLGFTKEDVGLHSLRSGGAMAMFLSGVATLIIQRVGRWESDAFMEYIREQVETFTLGVSSKMLLNQDYQHLIREEDERNNTDQNVPTLEGDGASFAIPHSAHFSKQVLNMTDMSRL